MNVSGPATFPFAIGHAPTSPIAPQDTTKTLLHEAGERKVTLSRDDKGRVNLTLSPPQVTQLVLSGGGAKGVAYPGAVKALEDRGALTGVRSISGSSAGAISATLLASGMSAGEFTDLSNDLDLSALMNSSNPLVRVLQETSSKVGNWLGQFSEKLQTAFTLIPRLGSKAKQLEALVRSKSRASVLARIAESPSKANLPEVKAIADKLEAGGVVSLWTCRS